MPTSSPRIWNEPSSANVLQANSSSATYIFAVQYQRLVNPVSGAVTLDGKMIDYANVRMARRIIGLGS